MSQPYILFFLGILATSVAGCFGFCVKVLLRVEHRLTKIETVLKTGDTDLLRKAA